VVFFSGFSGGLHPSLNKLYLFMGFSVIPGTSVHVFISSLARPHLSLRSILLSNLLLAYRETFFLPDLCTIGLAVNFSIFQVNSLTLECPLKRDFPATLHFPSISSNSPSFFLVLQDNEAVFLV